MHDYPFASHVRSSRVSSLFASPTSASSGARLLSLVFAACVVVAGTACEGGVPDAGPTPEPSTPADAGESAGGRLDGGTVDVDAGVDAGPTPPTLIAQRLCIAFIRGQAQAAADAASRVDARCSADDPLANLSAEPDAAIVDTARCLPGRADHQLFLDGVTGGRVEFNLDAIADCAAQGRAARTTHATLGTLEQREAALSAALVSECADVVTPLVSVGGSCTQAWDCPASAPCQADPRDSQSFACLEPAVEGEPCLDVALPASDTGTRTPLRVCAPELQCYDEVCTARLVLGAYCDATTVNCGAGLVCGPGNFCINPAAEGQTCGNAGHCEGDLQCRPSLGVDGGPVGGLTCQTPLASGAVADDEVCVDSDTCAELCSVCRPEAPLSDVLRCQDRGDTGDACRANAECRVGLFCSVDATCAPLRTVTAPCDAASPCAPELYCNADVNACQLRPTLGNPCTRIGPDRCAEGFCTNSVCVAGVGGDPCTGNSTCATGYFCVNTPQPDVDGGPQPSQNQCVAQPREGAPCTLDGRCVADTYCDGDRCRAFPGPGELCRNGACAPGAFCNGLDETSTCELARPPSSVCVSDNQCASTVCLDTGTCAALSARSQTTVASFSRFILLSGIPLGLLWTLAAAGRRRRRRALQAE